MTAASPLTVSRFIPQNHAPLAALRNELVMFHLESGNAYRAKRLAECGSAAVPLLPASHPASKWKQHCHLAECPFCRSEAVRTWTTKAAKVDQSLSSSGLKSRMVTVALPDCSGGQELRDAVGELAASHSLLLKRRSYQRHILGAARGIECAEADTGLIHAHAHLLFLYHDGGDVLADLPALLPSGFHSEARDGVALASFGGYLGKTPAMSAQAWLDVVDATESRAFVSLSGVLRKEWGSIT